MPKWEMMLVRAEGTTGFGVFEHFEPNEWSTGDIKKDPSLGEKNHHPAIHRFIMDLLDEGWEPLTITYTEPTFAIKKTDYLFRRVWEKKAEEVEEEEEAGEVEEEPESEDESESEAEEEAS